MTEHLPLALQALTLGAVAVIVYRLTARRALDPLGLEARVGKLEERAGAVERYQAHLAQQATQMERRLFERLDDVAVQQTKVLGKMTGIERIVDTEVRRGTEVSNRLDQISAAVSNVASRFGGIEAALQKVLDARPAAEGA